MKLPNNQHFFVRIKHVSAMKQAMRGGRLEHIEMIMQSADETLHWDSETNKTQGVLVYKEAKLQLKSE